MEFFRNQIEERMLRTPRSRERNRRTRDLTDKPFGVNLTILPSITPPPYEELHIVEIAGGNPATHLGSSAPVTPARTTFRDSC